MPITRSLMIDRRGFLVGVAASAAAGALPACGAEPLNYVRVRGPIFRQAVAHAVDLGWFRECVLHSEWHFDEESFEGRALIRHRMTRLTYLIFSDGEGLPAARLIAPECCPCNEAADPDYIVGHAARHVAADALRIVAASRERLAGPIYLRYPFGRTDWPAPDPIIDDAPPIILRPLTDPAVIATASPYRR